MPTTAQLLIWALGTWSVHDTAATKSKLWSGAQASDHVASSTHVPATDVACIHDRALWHHLAFWQVQLSSLARLAASLAQPPNS